MKVEVEIKKVHSRSDVAKVFNKSDMGLQTLASQYKKMGGFNGYKKENKPIPYCIFVSRLIRNTPFEFWSFFLNDDNFFNSDKVKKEVEIKINKFVSGIAKK